jgi:hypothetical protein
MSGDISPPHHAPFLFLPMVLPEFRRTCLSYLPEYTGEIRGVLEPQLICDLGNIQIRVS